MTLILCSLVVELVGRRQHARPGSQSWILAWILWAIRLPGKRVYLYRVLVCLE
jgi:hypothetical protein